MKKKGKVLVILALVAVMLVGFAVTANAAPPEESRERDAKALTRLFLKYDTENLGEYLAIKEEHRAFHESRKGLYEATKQRVAGQLNALIEALIDGEMTLEQAQEAFAENRDKVAEFRETLDGIRDLRQAEAEAIREDLQDVRTQIKDALSTDEVDEALMKDLLAQSLKLFNQHLQMDYKYAEQFDDVVGEYYPML